MLVWDNASALISWAGSKTLEYYYEDEEEEMNIVAYVPSTVSFSFAIDGREHIGVDVEMNITNIIFSIISIVFIYLLQYREVKLEPFFFDSWRYFHWICYFYTANLFIYIIHILPQQFTATIPFINIKYKTKNGISSVAYKTCYLRFSLLSSFNTSDTDSGSITHDYYQITKFDFDWSVSSCYGKIIAK